MNKKNKNIVIRGESIPYDESGEVDHPVLFSSSECLSCPKDQPKTKKKNTLNYSENIRIPHISIFPFLSLLMRSRSFPSAILPCNTLPLSKDPCYFYIDHHII